MVVYTLSWSPWKSCRKLAWVPVVPLTPRKRRSSRARSRFLTSITKSCSHRHARFPTVVNWAGLYREEERGTVGVFDIKVRQLHQSDEGLWKHCSCSRTHWKCVKPSVGRSAYSSAKFASRSMTLASCRKNKPSMMQIRVSNLFYIVGYKQPTLIFSSQKQWRCIINVTNMLHSLSCNL